MTDLTDYFLSLFALSDALSANNLIKPPGVYCKYKKLQGIKKKNPRPSNKHISKALLRYEAERHRGSTLPVINGASEEVESDLI